ncbi:MAG: hypothetical protein P8M30_05520 [Planctomycetaceae bacterium]|nr:hypothetical protein [Planctomycetaceae bacterium]
MAVGFSIGLFFLENPADHGFKNENSVAIVGGLSIVLYETMLILSVYSWISYHYTQLSLDESGVSFQTLAQNNQLAWTDLKSVEWVMQGYHGGIIIYSPITSFRVGLREFSRQDRLEIIRLLNGQILEDAQTGWPQFCHRFVIPLVNSVEQTEVNIQEMRSGKSSFEDNKERVEITRQRRFSIRFGSIASLSRSLAAVVQIIRTHGSDLNASNDRCGLDSVAIQYSEGRYS